MVELFKEGLLDQNKKVENILKDNQESEDEGGQNFTESQRIIQES